MSSKKKHPNRPAQSHQQAPQAQLIHQTQELQYQGPLPPPALLKQYDDVQEGTAERIITMAEEQSKHRQECEKAVIRTNARESMFGQITGTVIAASVLFLAGVMIFKGEVVIGVVTILLDFIGFLGSSYLTRPKIK